jgi:hypothetical protein
MAQIDIQEKQGPPPWVWIAGIVALLVVVGVIWALMANGDDRDDATMRQDTVPTAPEMPTSAIDRPDDAALPYIVFSATPGQAALST